MTPDVREAKSLPDRWLARCALVGGLTLRLGGWYLELVFWRRGEGYHSRPSSTRCPDSTTLTANQANRKAYDVFSAELSWIKNASRHIFSNSDLVPIPSCK